ncbi:putative chitinase [Colletotrichum sublineola]|uniref:Putative chitinase n=1 Tax=Colletotrichum sublineola TaxID=1173701 RepID=A0A066X2J4_COLSU|nr:putative chitinase [Colletotrichum sublineola]
MGLVVMSVKKTILYTPIKDAKRKGGKDSIYDRAVARHQPKNIGRGRIVVDDPSPTLNVQPHLSLGAVIDVPYRILLEIHIEINIMTAFLARTFVRDDTGDKASAWGGLTFNTINAGTSIIEDALTKASDEHAEAAAITAACIADRLAPIVMYFGPGYKIDARNYLFEQLETNSSGFRCPKGHSYFPAAIHDVPLQGWGQPQPIPGQQHNPTHKWIFAILKGTYEVQDDSTPRRVEGVTVDNIIIGQVAILTY